MSRAQTCRGSNHQDLLLAALKNKNPQFTSRIMHPKKYGLPSSPTNTAFYLIPVQKLGYSRLDPRCALVEQGTNFLRLDGVIKVFTHILPQVPHREQTILLSSSLLCQESCTIYFQNLQRVNRMYSSIPPNERRSGALGRVSAPAVGVGGGSPLLPTKFSLDLKI